MVPDCGVVVELFGTVLGSVALGEVVLGTVEGDVADGATVVPFIVVPPVAPVAPFIVVPPFVVASFMLVPVVSLGVVAPVDVAEFPFTVLVPVVAFVPVLPVVPAVAAGFVPFRSLGCVEVPDVVPTPV